MPEKVDSETEFHACIQKGKSPCCRVVRKDVSVNTESQEEPQRLWEAFWRVLLDLPLDSWHLACDGHQEPLPGLHLGGVEVLVP